MELRRIRIHPVKSLAGVDVQSAGFTASGGLREDRRWCFVQQDASDVTPDSVYMTKVDKNAETSSLGRTRVHHGSMLGVLSLELDGHVSAEFRLPEDCEAMSAWCSERYGVTLRLEESTDHGWPDVAVYGSPAEYAAVSGPTVISTVTIAYLSDRLELSPEELLFRFRTNLLVHADDLEPFGEDELTEITLGDVRLEVVGRVTRCPVPGRDATSGRFDRTFARRFVEAKAACPSGKTLQRSELYTVSVFTRVLTPQATLSTEPESDTQSVDWNAIKIPPKQSE